MLWMREVDRRLDVLERLNEGVMVHVRRQETLDNVLLFDVDARRPSRTHFRKQGVSSRLVHQGYVLTQSEKTTLGECGVCPGDALHMIH